MFNFYAPKKKKQLPSQAAVSQKHNLFCYMKMFSLTLKTLVTNNPILWCFQ